MYNLLHYLGGAVVDVEVAVGASGDLSRLAGWRDATDVSPDYRGRVNSGDLRSVLRVGKGEGQACWRSLGPVVAGKLRRRCELKLEVWFMNLRLTLQACR